MKMKSMNTLLNSAMLVLSFSCMSFSAHAQIELTQKAKEVVVKADSKNCGKGAIVSFAKLVEGKCHQLKNKQGELQAELIRKWYVIRCQKNNNVIYDGIVSDQVINNDVNDIISEVFRFDVTADAETAIKYKDSFSGDKDQYDGCLSLTYLNQ